MIKTINRQQYHKIFKNTSNCTYLELILQQKGKNGNFLHCKMKNQIKYENPADNAIIFNSSVDQVTTFVCKLGN